MTSATPSPERTPNSKLRAAREALGASGASRVSRATLVRNLQDQAREMGVHDVGFDVTKVQRWEEKGMRPRDEALDVLAAYFARHGYTLADLGLGPEPTQVCTPLTAAPTVTGRDAPSGVPVQEDDEVKRRQLATGIAALAGLPILNQLSEPVQPLPAKIGRRHIEQIRDDATAFSALVDARGGLFARVAVVAELEWCAELLRLPCPAALRPKLFGAVAGLAETGGFAMFDALDHENARKVFRFGLACAEEAADWSRRAQILGHVAAQATWLGNADEALTHIELAQVRSDWLSATEQARLHAARARALAHLGRYQETLRAIGEADQMFGQGGMGADAAWLNYRRPAQLSDTGHALADLEMRGKQTTARTRLAGAADHSDAFARSRTISQIRLATLTMVNGDPREAACIGQKALDWATQIRSRRVNVYLAELGEHAGQHAKILEVAALRQQIGEMTAA